MENTSIDSDQIIVREYRKGDEVEINLLHNEQYGTHRTNKEWEWEFREGPYGASIFVVAEHNGDIVGTQALLPIMISYKGIQILTAKSEETLLKPEYRGRKVFHQLYSKCFELAKKRGINLVWGFTNADKPFKKLEFHVVGRLNHAILILDPNQTYNINRNKMFAQVKKRISRQFVQRMMLRCFSWGGFLWYKSRARRITAESEYVVESLAHDDNRLDICAKEFDQTVNSYSISRTTNYLKWRVFRNPNVDYQFLIATHSNKIKGYIILGKSKRENVGSIIDFCALEDHFTKVAKLLISHAISYFHEQNVAYVDAWMNNKNSESKKYTSCLSRSGFLPIPMGSCMIVKVLGDAEGFPADPYSIDQWFITNIFSEGVG